MMLVDGVQMSSTKLTVVCHGIVVLHNEAHHAIPLDLCWPIDSHPHEDIANLDDRAPPLVAHIRPRRIKRPLQVGAPPWRGEAGSDGPEEEPAGAVGQIDGEGRWQRRRWRRRWRRLHGRRHSRRACNPPLTSWCLFGRRAGPAGLATLRADAPPLGKGGHRNAVLHMANVVLRQIARSPAGARKQRHRRNEGGKHEDSKVAHGQLERAAAHARVDAAPGRVDRAHGTVEATITERILPSECGV